MTKQKNDPLLEKLKGEIALDAKPQKPLASSWRRALFLLPLWGVSILIVVGVFGIRNDYETLGAWMSWSLALAQLGTAYGLFWAGLRLVIPGSGYATTTIPVLFSFALLLHLSIAAITFRLSPVWVPFGREWSLSLICFVAILFFGGLPLAVAGMMAVRGLTTWPLLVGGLCGLGAGLAGEAAWRMHCSISAWDHVLKSHGAAVIGMMLLGILAGMLWRRQQVSSRL